jgi:streptogramin lyase
MDEADGTSTPDNAGNTAGAGSTSASTQTHVSRLAVLRRAVTRSRSRRGRDVWFMLAVLALGVVTVFVLTGRGANIAPSSGADSHARVPATTTSATSATSQPAPAAAVRAAGATTFMIEPSNIGLMQPAVDAQGNIWFGEMAANRLARLDPGTGQVSSWQPPNGHYNIMAAAIDAHGKVWFTEQAGNYLGRFDPITQSFTTYPLGANGGRGTAPQDLQFDSAGKLWFTEITAGQIGRLDPATGAIQTWHMPVPAAGTPAYPYSLAVLPNGQVWFGYLAGGAVGHLDPTTSAVTLYHLADSGAQVFSMSADGQGRVWFTELEVGRLGMVDTGAGKLTEVPIPTVAGDPTGNYAIVAARGGDVWFGSAGANALVRYSPPTHTFTFYSLDIQQSIPFGLALDGRGRLWFTADASPTNYVGMMPV